MKRKEFTEAFHNADTEQEKKELAWEYWDEHSRVKMVFFSLTFLIIAFMIGIWLGIVIWLIRFIAF